MKDHNQKMGREGENQALAFFQEKGYGHCESNYHTRWGEIDLIVENKSTLVFVEVKHRQTFDFGDPIEAITPSKIKKMVRAAMTYCTRTGRWNKTIRFDVVTITPQGIRHYENAFLAGGEYYF